MKCRRLLSLRDQHVDALVTDKHSLLVIVWTPRGKDESIRIAIWAR